MDSTLPPPPEGLQSAPSLQLQHHMQSVIPTPPHAVAGGRVIIPNGCLCAQSPCLKERIWRNSSRKFQLRFPHHKLRLYMCPLSVKDCGCEEVCIQFQDMERKRWQVGCPLGAAKRKADDDEHRRGRGRSKLFIG